MPSPRAHIEAWLRPMLGPDWRLPRSLRKGRAARAQIKARLRAMLGPNWGLPWSLPEGRVDGATARVPDDGNFIASLYETVLSRGATARDVCAWRGLLASGERTRDQLLRLIFEEACKERLTPSQPDGSLLLMGTGTTLDRKGWQALSAEADSLPKETHARFAIRPHPGTKVSIITTIYRARKYIQQFMENMTNQTLFDRSELIIIDANSPENEQEIIEAYKARFSQIVYYRLPYTCTIYAAWNLAIAMAKGMYVTNANADDLRRHDSLELQAAVLDNLPFVDVVYQDFLYSFEPTLCFDAIRRINVRSRLPLITPHSLAAFNSPHNAPMWRKSLHSDIGYFDDCLRSAADWEFWIRCLISGKRFFKLNDPHVAYFVNPAGMSTRVDGPGREEVGQVSKRLMRKLMPEAVMMDETDFNERFGIRVSVDDPSGRSRYRNVQSMLRELAENRVGEDTRTQTFRS